MVVANGQYQNGTIRMPTPWDDFITAIERRKAQLDDLLAAYAKFREKLAAIPPEIAQEAQSILAAAEAEKLIEENAKKTDLVGKPALECAQIILHERRNEPTHFSIIARTAMDRGYKGRAEGSAVEVENRIQNSFWAALHRSSEFESVGKGCYRLRVDDVADAPTNETDEELPRPRITQKEAARRILHELGRSAKVAEILDIGLERGWFHIVSERRFLFNAIYGLMMRSPDTFKRVGKGTFTLVGGLFP